jgi:polyphosphate kinase 2
MKKGKNGKKGSNSKPADSKDAAGARKKLKGKEYRRELARLHVELVKLQEWVKGTGAKICIVFEGRDGAGKGGTIKAITERVSPRVFRVIALPAPTEREKSQMYIQRYLPHLPAAGEIMIFDRSWYNRAGVERVMGFCTEEQARFFLKAVPGVEKAIVDSGVILLKYWLEVSSEEQTRRLEARIDDGRKIWKLSPMDLKSYSRWGSEIWLSSAANPLRKLRYTWELVRTETGLVGAERTDAGGRLDLLPQGRAGEAPRRARRDGGDLHHAARHRLARAAGRTETSAGRRRSRRCAAPPVMSKRPVP